jgi:hypothetical protein
MASQAEPGAPELRAARSKTPSSPNQPKARHPDEDRDRDLAFGAKRCRLTPSSRRRSGSCLGIRRRGIATESRSRPARLCENSHDQLRRRKTRLPGFDPWAAIFIGVTKQCVTLQLSSPQRRLGPRGSGSVAKKVAHPDLRRDDEKSTLGSHAEPLRRDGDFPLGSCPRRAVVPIYCGPRSSLQRLDERRPRRSLQLNLARCF